MNNIKIKKLLLIISASVIVSVGVIKTTLSAFTSNDEIVNKFEIGDVNIENEEIFKPDKPNNDGSIDKIVSVKNVTTKTPVLVRVNITPRWVEIKDEEGKEIEIPWSGDASDKVVTLNFDNIIPYSKDFERGKWIDGKDGYYYYTSILLAEDNPETKDIKENETSTILKSVKINLKDDEGNNLVENPEDYEGKTLIVDVNSEAVQPTEQAYLDAWGENLGDDIKTMLNGLLKIGNNNSEDN